MKLMNRNNEILLANEWNDKTNEFINWEEWKNECLYKPIDLNEKMKSKILLFLFWQCP